MTTAVDHVPAFLAALPDDIRPHVNTRNGRPTRTVEYHLGLAITRQHWSIEQLATECTRDLDNAGRVAAVITERLKVAATIPPPGTTRPKAKGRPFCSPECADNAGWILDADRHPIRRCPCRTEGAKS